MPRKTPFHSTARKKRKNTFLFRVIVLVLVALLLIVAADWRLRPVVEEVSAHQAKVSALSTINTAIMGELEREGVNYDQLITVTQSGDGQISSIQTDMMAVNQLKTRIVHSIIEDLEQEENRSIHVPVGTLMGSQLTSGRGPYVEIQVLPTGYVQSDIYNEFTSAGINQTLHRIMLHIEVEVLVILPGYSVETKTGTDFCIAETVIVGRIPDGYTVVEGDSRSDLSKIFDYSARE